MQLVHSLTAVVRGEASHGWVYAPRSRGVHQLVAAAARDAVGGFLRRLRELPDVREVVDELPRCSAAGCVLERQTLKPGFRLIGYRLWV
jgi:hypothetical protein